MKRRLLAIATIGLALFGVFPAFAHEPAREEWAPPSAGPLTTWTAPLCGRGRLVAQPFFFYNRARGSFSAGGDYSSLPEGDKKYQYQQQLFVQYGLMERFEVDGQTVYQQNFVKRGDLKAHDEGFGDSIFFARYCVLHETETLPHLTVLAQAKLPTGRFESADPDKLGTDLMGATSGGGSYDHGYGINLTKRLKPFILHVDAIYNFPIETDVNGVDTEYGEYLNYDFGVEIFFPAGFNLMLEFNGFLQGDRREGSGLVADTDIRYLTIAPGIGWSNDRVQALLAYQRTLTGTNTDANDSVIFTFVYTF